jgi:hypothetical protein
LFAEFRFMQKRLLKFLLFAGLLVVVAYAAIWCTNYRVFLPDYRSAIYTPAAYKRECPAICRAAYTLSVRQRSVLLRETVSQKLFPYWAGTRWNFNGTTETPGQGSIACGYFVMTVLRDAGFDFPRKELACMASEEAIRSLVIDKSIVRYHKTPLDKFLAGIRKNGDQLYLVGLDTHIGFLSCENGECWFIHSGGGFSAGVVKEKAEHCSSLANSSYRVTGCLTADENSCAHGETDGERNSCQAARLLQPAKGGYQGGKLPLPRIQYGNHTNKAATRRYYEVGR